MNSVGQNLAVPILIAVGVVVIVLVIVYLQRQAQLRAWRGLASQLGLACESGRYPWSAVTVHGSYRGHGVALDTFQRGIGRNQRTLTGIVMDVNNPSGLRMNLVRQGGFGQVGKWLGAQDIQVGDADIDRRFLIKGQPEEAIRRLFTSEGLRQALLALSSLDVTLEGATLRYEQPGVARGIERLRSLFDLLSELAIAVEQAG
jgi:hypothetical protein